MKKDHWCTTYQLLQSAYTHAYTSETWPNGQGKKQQGQGGTSCDIEDILSPNWGLIIRPEESQALSNRSHEALKMLHEHRDSCPSCINHFSDIK